MRAFVIAVMLAACGGSSSGGDGPPGKDSPGPGDGFDGAGSSEWLVVQGNHILRHGAPFHGRGANLHDERSCSACSFAARQPAGIDRWSDELIDNWHANLVRFLLSAKAAPFNASEQQWMNLVDDPQYLADIIANVNHMTAKPGVYVEVTLFADPTIKDNNQQFDSEWPSSLGDSNTRYRALAEAFHDNPHVLFGLTNEPHTTPAHDAELAAVYTTAIAAIRAVEDSHGSQHHVVVVQAPEGFARDLSYFIAHPLADPQVAYEIHPYNPATDFDALIVQPSHALPLIIGEYGPENMTDNDIRALWATAEANEVPYIAWAFHQRCPPNLLQDTAADGCGLAASQNYTFPRTAWGELLHAHLATPW